jgi:hypothetical protein
MKVQLDLTEICSLTSKPSQHLHPWPVTRFAAMTFTPAHLRHILIPRDYIPSILVVDIDSRTTDFKQPFCCLQVLCPNCLEETPLWGDTAGLVQLSTILKAKGKTYVKKCTVTLSQNEPNKLSQHIG